MIGHTNLGKGRWHLHDLAYYGAAKRYAPPSRRGFLLQAPRRLIATLATPQEVGDSVHLPDELIDVIFPVTMIATLYIVLEFACSPATGWVR